jgi:hypothetical protein
VSAGFTTRSLKWYEFAVDLTRDEMTIFVGPDRSARLLEVGVVYADYGTPVIVHAMPARPRFLR